MINYKLIGEAIEHYSALSYVPYDLPWTADLSALKVTMPEEARGINSDLGYLVGSAEQSFLDYVARNGINGKFQATTPCFREEHEDELHKSYFLKTELFINDEVSDLVLDTVIFDANSFFLKYLETAIVNTNEGFDIVEKYTGIELGSYGIRQHIDFGAWVYGTGCAEPRFSYLIDLRKSLK